MLTGKTLLTILIFKMLGITFLLFLMIQLLSVYTIRPTASQEKYLYVTQNFPPQK